MKNSGIRQNLKFREVKSLRLGGSKPCREVAESKSVATLPQIQHRYVLYLDIYGKTATEFIH